MSKKLKAKREVNMAKIAEISGKKKQNQKTFKSIRAFECYEICVKGPKDISLYLKTAQLKKEIGEIDGKKYGTYTLHNVTCTPDVNEGIKFIFINTYIKDDPVKGVDLYELGKKDFLKFAEALAENLMNSSNGALELKATLEQIDINDVSSLDECVICDHLTVKNILSKLDEKFEIVEDD